MENGNRKCYVFISVATVVDDMFKNEQLSETSETSVRSLSAYSLIFIHYPEGFILKVAQRQHFHGKRSRGLSI